MYITSSKLVFFFIWIVSLALMILAYLATIDQEHLLIELKFNNSKSILNLYQENNSERICIGNLTTTLTGPEELKNLNYTGTLQIQENVNAESAALNFSGNLSFNAFQQLGALNFGLYYKNLGIQVNGSNINPIKLLIKILNQKQIVFEDLLEVSGPILLIKNQKHYQIQLPNFKLNKEQTKFKIPDISGLAKIKIKQELMPCKQEVLKLNLDLLKRLVSK